MDLTITSYNISNIDFIKITPNLHKNMNWKMEYM